MKALLVSSLLLFSSFATYARSDEPPTVTYVDLTKYVGTWYEIARFPFSQQQGCFNTTATYSLNSDGSIKVVNSCRKNSAQGPVSTAVAQAKVVDTVSNAKLKVKFFIFAPWADYWIIRLEKNYEYAVVSQPERKYLWILSRTPVMEERTYHDIVTDLKADHFNTSLLEKTPQQWGEL